MAVLITLGTEIERIIRVINYSIQDRSIFPYKRSGVVEPESEKIKAK